MIDRETVITGSFNFTKAAEEKNAENLLILKSKDLARVYISNWEEHKEHSEPYEAQMSSKQKGSFERKNKGYSLF